MKRTNTAALITLLAALMLTLAACGRSEFGATVNEEKLMIITAEKANKDDFFTVGTLVAAEGEEVRITANLTAGEVKVEILEMPADQSGNRIPEIDDDPILMSNLKLTDSVAGTVSEGKYLVRATCLEKATGTIEVAVNPAA